MSAPSFSELAKEADRLVEQATHIVIIQGDNADGDSLASSLALEQILGELGKQITMYCSVSVPEYLKHLEGWDRVQQDFPTNYDLAIMVDNSYLKLLDNLTKNSLQLARLRDKPLVILDHHPTETDIDFCQVYINQSRMAATGQVIFCLAKELGWKLDRTSATYLASSILSDSLGFNSEIMRDNPDPLRVMAELVELGVDLADLNDKRLERLKIEPQLVAYRGQLLQRIQFHHGQQIATVTIPHEEIRQYSMGYNPTVILDEMRMVRGVRVCIGFKQYSRNGQLFRVTARIRCNRGWQIAQDLAEAFGGGGHVYASGIKWEGDSLDFDQIRNSVISKAAELLRQKSS